MFFDFIFVKKVFSMQHNLFVCQTWWNGFMIFFHHAVSMTSKLYVQAVLMLVCACLYIKVLPSYKNCMIFTSVYRQLWKSYKILYFFTRHHTKIVWFSSLPKKRIAWYKHFFIREKFLHKKEWGKSYIFCMINILLTHALWCVPCMLWYRVVGNRTLSVAGLFHIFFFSTTRGKSF